MSILDADALLGDFEDEARAHIAKIEAAFLDIGAIAASASEMDGVFRAAHSLKGTAGFFSFGKIVAVAHALENIFTQIKDGTLKPGDEISDAVLAAVDALKALTDNLQGQDEINIASVLRQLERFDAEQKTDTPETKRPKAKIAFDLFEPETEKALKAAVKRGHKIYTVQLSGVAGLGSYRGRPEALVGDIVSVGAVIAATAAGKRLADTQAPRLAAALAALEKNADTAALLVTSILELDLFLVAVELAAEAVHMIPQAELFPPRPQASIAETPREPVKKEKAELSIRLDIKTVNGLMDIANELILTRNQLLSSLDTQTRAQPGLSRILQDVSRLTGDFQDKIIRARMQPVGNLFGKFPRVIHDVARSLGKEIRLETAGESVGLDKYLLDSLSDPITQIVKNAADHGIETPERRKALGKPEQGVVVLCAYIYDGWVVIEITDDGAGMDFSALTTKALERGAVTKERLVTMTRPEIAALAFTPGISTAKKLTSVSGRGVGMDIVKTNIEKLGGSIEIDSEQNIGTTIRIKMPQTLSAVRTLIIKENGILYGVPETNVEYLVRVTAENPARRLEFVNGTLMLSFEGRIIPAITLSAAEAKDKGAGQKAAKEPEESTLARLAQSVVKCLVLKTGERNFALLIEDAVAVAETLVNPLPNYLRACRCYAGVTVLGSGNAIAILDAEGIARLLGIEGAPRSLPPEENRQSEKAAGQAIVFKGSGEALFALDAQAVRKIERIDAAAIQAIGDNRFVEIGGRAVRLLRPEDYAPVRGGETHTERPYLVAMGGEGPPIGFLSGKVLDKIESVYAAASGNIGGEYVLGAGEYGRKTVIFLNIEAILRSLAVKAERPDKGGGSSEGDKLLRGRRVLRRRRKHGEQGSP